MLPKVLIINGEPFTEASASGLTMVQLFQGWPAERLAQIYTSAALPDFRICQRYWRLAATGALLGRMGGPVEPPRAGATAASPAPVSHQKAAGVAACPWLSGWVRQELRAASELVPWKADASLRQWIREFAPDVIYSYLGAIRLMRLVREIARDLRVPVVPHFMDDWPSTLYEHSILAPVLRRKLQSELREVLNFSPTRLAIGEEMAREFDGRYGPRFHPFMNCVDDRRLDQPVGELAARPVLRLAYVGGLHLNRWQSLVEIGQALRSLRAEGIPAELVIYGFVDPASKIGQALAMPPEIRLAGRIPAAQVAAAQEDADVLVHVESFQPGDRKYTRFSVSTKIPEYLAAGRPILGYGPGETASMRYLEQIKTGFVVGERDPAALGQAIRQLLGDPARRRALGTLGKEVAGRAHRASTERQKFQALLAELAPAKS